MLSDKLSYFSNRIQLELFHLLESETMTDLLESHRKVATILEVIQIERFMPSHIPFSKGRPSHSRTCIARSFIAKHVMNLCSTSFLIHMLKVDKNLRYICGWQPYQTIPSESTFSRAFRELSESKILTEVHECLTRDVFEGHFVIECARDSVPIPARESEDRETKQKSENKRYPKRDQNGKKVTRTEYQAISSTSLDEMLSDLPKQCDIGKKTDSRGISQCWRGYKLHLDVAEGRFPISCLLTSASTHDSQAAIPLSIMSSSRTTILYEVMDSAYDVNAIRGHIQKSGHVPIINMHKRRGKRKELIESNRQAHSVLNWKPSEERRLEKRIANERSFASLKNSFLGFQIWVRTHTKVMCHVMLGILVLFANELLCL